MGLLPSERSDPSTSYLEEASVVGAAIVDEINDQGNNVLNRYRFEYLLCEDT